jgi:hypothetical protein
MMFKLIEHSILYLILNIIFTLYFRKRLIPNHINRAQQIKMAPNNINIGEETRLENLLLTNLTIYSKLFYNCFLFKQSN